MQIHYEVRGVIVPLLTPYDEEGESLDEEALEGNIAWLLERGVHGFMPCGTTGETPLLTLAERKRILEITVRATRGNTSGGSASGGRAPVLAHVGAASTATTIELARHAAEVGAEAISVVTPWYFRLSEDALLAHYCRVANAVPQMPLFLYNIPQNANNTIDRTLAERIIAHCPNVVGIKDSAGKMDSLASFVGLREGTFQVICGSDLLQFAALEAGAVAGVSGNANVVPEIVVGLYNAYAAGDKARAQQEQQRLDAALQAMGNGGSLALFKAVGAWRGQRLRSVRAPLPPTTPDVVAATVEKLSALGIQT